MRNNTKHRQNEICYAEMVNPKHLWGTNTYPLQDSVPRLVIQLALAGAVNHGFLFIFRRCNQPRFVSNLMTAFIVSPSTLRKIHHKLPSILIPPNTVTILETVANLGLLYATFIEALQANDIPILQTRPKMFFHSCLAFITPFFVGCTLHYGARNFIIDKPTTSSNNFFNITGVYWGAIITSTTFKSISPILSKLKLLCTQIGQETLFISLFNDFCTWILINVILAISTSSDNFNNINYFSTFCILVSMVVFLVFCCTLIKPSISRIITLNSMSEGENYTNFVIMILFLVFAIGFITNYIGAHFVFGAYVLGRCVPPGILSETIIEKMEECVDGVLMPLYFMMIGLKLDIFHVISNIEYTAWIIALAIATKGLCTLVTGVCCKVSLDESLPLGVLINAKGFLPLVLLNVGYERGIMTNESFTVLYLAILLSTMMVGPIMSKGYKRIKKSYQSNDENILQGAEFSRKPNFITCIHSSRNIPSILNLLEISNIEPEYPALIYVTHLVELVGHATAFVTEHDLQESKFWTHFLSSMIFFDRARARSGHVIKAFNEYLSDENKATIWKLFKILTVVSPFDTMHEDICCLAEDKKASLIILPYHKQQGVDGMLDDVDIEFGVVNQKVLEMAPCSVGLLVDRGLRVMPSSMTPAETPLHNVRRGRDSIHIAMVFIGGPDDREALTYAWRMILGEQSYVLLTVIRFVEGDNVMGVDQVTHYLHCCNGDNKIDISSLYELKEREDQIDDEFLETFEQKTIDNGSVNYLNYMVNSGEEFIETLKDLDPDFDLYIIGRGKTRFSLLSLGLIEWNLCSELGVIGNVLVSSDFTSNASVLVIQQYPDARVNQINFEGNDGEEDSVLVNSFQEP